MSFLSDSCQFLPKEIKAIQRHINTNDLLYTVFHFTV
jgi:hypothetical protein